MDTTHSTVRGQWVQHTAQLGVSGYNTQHSHGSVNTTQHSHGSVDTTHSTVRGQWIQHSTVRGQWIHHSTVRGQRIQHKAQLGVGGYNTQHSLGSVDTTHSTVRGQLI